MATDHLQIPDISATQNQKEVTANEATNLLDRALNQISQVAVSAGDNALSTTNTRENMVLELTGTPGGAVAVQMPDTNERLMVIYNNSDSEVTVENSASGGTGNPVISVGEASLFHYDGVDFLDLTDLALAATTFTGLTDTPANYTGSSGKIPQVNLAETAVEFIRTAVKLPVRAATIAAATLATDFENLDIIDGVTLATGDRILIKDQAAGAENGIYEVQASGAPVRTEDFDDDADVVGGGVMVVVQEGTLADTLWALTNNGAIVVGTTALTFAQLGSTSTFIALTDTPSAYTDQSGTEVRVNDGETALEFAPKTYKDPVVAATTAAGTLATDYENADTLDGVTLATGDRILIKDQGTASENGIYIVQASGAPVRAADFDDDADAVAGAIIGVTDGTTNGETMWMHTTLGAITLGSTSLTFAQTGGAGAAQRYTEATVTTTDATTTNISTIALASGDATAVRGFLIGTEPSSANSFAVNFFAAGKNNGGTSAELAAEVKDTIDGAAGAWSFDIDVDDTTDTIRLRVTGAAATTVNWTVQYETITET